MREFEYGARFLHEFLLKSVHHIAVARSGNGYVAGVSIAVAVFLVEKLLDGDFSLQHSVLRQIGDAEATLTEGGNDAIFAVLERGAG